MAAGVWAADNQLTPREKAEGWKLMFDGKTFAGWEDPTKKSPPGDSYTIDDGCLKSTRRPRYNEDLFTLDTYQDFEMEFDWKISPGGNSGVKYRIQDRVWLPPSHPMEKFETQVNDAMAHRITARPERGQEYVIGFEYQALDNQRHPDARRGTNHQTGALYDFFSPIRDVTRPVGEFNHSRIVVKGDHIEHWLNGVKVVDGSLKDPVIQRDSAARWGADSPVTKLLVDQPKKSCQISLQNHGDEAWFKNLKIRRL
ncbi:MAG: DUF1080 domain-containing protein [Acidobacteria bacterium]|nr:DUF1080 domain-containing protein [Acidobacteriota bacterium]